MERRRLLEESPIPSTNEEPVLFDTAEIPWWAWVRRFHLPEVRHQPAATPLSEQTPLATRRAAAAIKARNNICSPVKRRTPFMYTAL